MIIAPLRITDPWLHRLTRDPKADVRTLSAMSCDIAVRMESVSVLHHDADQNHRPYLHLRGQLLQVRPDVALPYGVTELPFRSGTEPTIDAFYEFDTDQLSQLVHKGYFGPRFRVPDSMIGIVWELPAEADFLVVAPEHVDQPPLVFVGVHDQNSAVLTEENSGYTLAEYFPDYSTENSEQLAAEARTAVPTHSEQIQDLFADEELDEVPRDRSAFIHRDPSSKQSLSEQLPKGMFDRLLEEVEARRRVEEETRRPGVDYIPESPEGLLRDRIIPGVEKALAGPVDKPPADTLPQGPEEVVETRVGFDDFLDLGTEDEEGFGEADVTSVGLSGGHPSGRFAARHTGERRGHEEDHQPGG